MSEYPVITTPIIQLTETLSDPYLRGIIKAYYLGTLIKTSKFDKINDALNSIFNELEQIDAEDLRGDILIELADVLIQTKYDKVKEILDRIVQYINESFKREKFKTEVLIHVVCAFAHNDLLDIAKDTFLQVLEGIRKIRSEKDRIINLCKWPVTFGLATLKLSDETIDNIITLVNDFSEEHRPRALRCVCEILIRLMQFSKAEELAEQIENKKERDALLRELAKGLLENKNYGHAVEIINKIELEHEKASVLKYWAKLIVQ